MLTSFRGKFAASLAVIGAVGLAMPTVPLPRRIDDEVEGPVTVSGNVTLDDRLPLPRCVAFGRRSRPSKAG